nr:hypothetical protein [bacterium]
MSRKSISHFWKLILSSVFLFAVTVPCAGKVNTSIKNISSKGLTFEYLPELSSGVEISNQILKLTIEGSDIFKSPGQPEVPVVYFTVAVPENSNPEVRIISADSGLSWNGRLPIFNIDDSSLDFTPVSTLSRPDEILGKPELRNLAGNKVLRIPVFPVKYRIGSNRVDLLKKIIIKIDFNENTTDLEKKGKYVSKIPRNQISRLSELILLNPDQARIFNVPEIGNFITPVWPNGLLYQFEIATEGIFSLKFEDIISRGVDLPVNGLNSSRLRLFSNGGGMLDENPELLTPVGLLECAIYMDDGGDNRFETGDRIIFYGRGAGGWFRDSDNVWKFQTNSYANRNIYWLNIDPSGGGRRMERISSSQSPDYTITSAPVKLHLETDQFIYYRSNFTGAGRSWYSFLFDGVSQLPLNFDLDSPDPSQDALLKAKVFASSSSSNPRILLHFNNIEIKNFQPSTNHISSESYETVNLDADLIRQNLNSLTMQQTTEGSKALFDWLEIEYYSKLDGTKIFESAPLTGKVKYQFQNLANILVFDITDHNSVELYDGQNFINYQDENDSRRFIVIDSNKIKQVNATFEEYFPEDSDISDLWAQSNRADVILITPDGFWEQLNPLVDYYNRKQPPLIAKRVRLSEIYNKFSGGLQDPAAIRNFLMFTLSDRWRKSPDYVVFCGDGDYNYRNINREETGFYLPPFEGLKFGRCQDDWFVDFNFETV